MEDDLPGPGVGRLPPVQKFVRRPNPQGHQQKALGRLPRRPEGSQQLRQIVVQGVAGHYRLIQMDYRIHTGGWTAFVSRGP
jgi:hypothetical protein